MFARTCPLVESMMFSQDDIDAVLSEAQEAVDTLVDDVNDLTDKPHQEAEAQPALSTPPPTSAPPPVPRAVQPVPQTSGGVPVDKLLQLRVPVAVRLAEQKLPIGEVIKLKPGTILEFDRKVEDELDFMVNRQQIGHGVAVKVDESFGIRITYIGDLETRINSLAG